MQNTTCTLKKHWVNKIHRTTCEQITSLWVQLDILDCALLFPEELCTVSLYKAQANLQPSFHTGKLKGQNQNYNSRPEATWALARMHPHISAPHRDISLLSWEIWAWLFTATLDPTQLRCWWPIASTVAQTHHPIQTWAHMTGRKKSFATACTSP